MNWCCLAFKGCYEDAGKRGLAVLVGRDLKKHPQFILQHRAVEEEHEKSVRSETMLSLVTDNQIHYCPWCGRELAVWYRDDIDKLYRPDLKIPYP